MKIMAGGDKLFEGETTRGRKEIILEVKTVQENIDLGVAKSQATLDSFTQLSFLCGVQGVGTCAE